MSKVLKLRTAMAELTEDVKVIPVQPVTIPVEVVDEADAAALTAEDVESLLQAARAEAEALLQDAHARAEQMLLDASSRVEAERMQARQAGHQEGYAEGLRQALEDMEAQVQIRVAAAEEVLQRANDERIRLMKDMHLPITSICMESIRQLLRREVVTGSADVEHIVSELLQFVTESAKVEVRVHPDDYAAATEAHPMWQSAKFGDWEVVVVPDVTLSPGGCEIRSDAGRVDATVETKLQLLQDTLTSVMERGVAQYAATFSE